MMYTFLTQDIPNEMRLWLLAHCNAIIRIVTKTKKFEGMFVFRNGHQNVLTQITTLTVKCHVRLCLHGTSIQLYLQVKIVWMHRPPNYAKMLVVMLASFLLPIHWWTSSQPNFLDDQKQCFYCFWSFFYVIVIYGLFSVPKISQQENLKLNLMFCAWSYWPCSQQIVTIV